MLYEGLDIYQAKIEDVEDGIFCISLVDFPAVEKDFVCFKSNNKQNIRFSIEDADKHNITGVVMLADTPIFRRTGDYEYYITYSPSTIEKMANKLLKDGFQNRVNLQHDGNLISGISMSELYIKNSDKGINPTFISDIPDGSLMATFHVEDEELWDEIKNGDMLNGFSLEGLFTIEKMKQINNNNKNNSVMSKLTKFIKSLMKFGELTTDKGVIYWDGEDDIEVGVEVYVDGEDETKVLAEDGEYSIDEKVIVIENGKVTEIREIEKEPETEEVVVDLKQEKFNKIKTAFEESYEEKERKIVEAIRSLGFDCYLVEAGDNYAVVDTWNNEIGGYHSLRFTISWNEEGEVVIGEFEEVKPAFVPIDTDVEKVAEEEKTTEDVVEQFSEEEVIVENEPDNTDEIEVLKNEIEVLKSEIEGIKEVLTKITNEPVVEPIVEEFESVKKSTTVKDNKLQKRIDLVKNLNS